MGDDGQEYKAFNSLDGHGMRMLQEAGIKAAIITGRKSSVVEHRMKDLGITLVFQGYRDKIPAYEALMADIGLDRDQVAYVGDDVVDLPIMTRVGFAVAVQDAHPYVKKHAHWITQNNGGQGAVRDVCELVLEARGHTADPGHYRFYRHLGRNQGAGRSNGCGTRPALCRCLYKGFHHVNHG